MGGIEVSIEKVESIISNKSFLLNMKKNHILESSKSKRENLFNAAVQSLDSTFRENDSELIESNHKKLLEKSIKNLEFTQDLLEEYSKEVRNSSMTGSIGTIFCVLANY